MILNEHQLRSLLPVHKISNEEFEMILKSLGRLPSFEELGIFSAMWSEHCSYKSSRIHLKRFPTEGKHVVVGPGENAGVIRISNKLCVAFKMESHNHPSYIEPYQGAATGVGGILRDVFCMGARPIANLNALRFGSVDHPKTKSLFNEVVRGIGDYGNCVGIPTVGGNISFDESYNGNCLVNAMTVGVIHEDKIFKGFASGVGNLLIYIGSATGRDGIHGASMASDSFQSSTNQERSAVQVGDPFAEKLLLEITLELLEAGLVVGLQDMGAAGLTSSSFEMAGRAGNGLKINLDLVPTRAKNMNAYELLLSESQERMLLVIKPQMQKEVERRLARWGLSYATIGEVTDTGRVVMTFNGEIVVDLPVGIVTDDAPKYDKPRKSSLDSVSSQEIHNLLHKKLQSQDALKVLEQIISDEPEYEFVWKQYDHHIGTRTVLSSVEGGAAVLCFDGDYLRWMSPQEQEKGICIATACNEQQMAVDSYEGASYAVLKCARSIFACGGNPLAITDCLNFGNPNDPQVMADFSDSVDGISKACNELGMRVVSGNVSLYNQTDGVSIKPTPMIGCVGVIDNVYKAVPAKTLNHEAETIHLNIILPKECSFSFVGSKISKFNRLSKRTKGLPSINWTAEKNLGLVLQTLIAEHRESLYAVRDVGVGGILTAVLKCFGVAEIRQLDTQAHFVNSALNALKKLSSIFSRFGEKEVLFGEGSGAYIVLGTEKTSKIISSIISQTDSLMVVDCGLLKKESHGSI